MSRMSMLVLIALAALWWAVGNLRRALPPDLVIIQAGPPGGSFDAHARRYAEHLNAQGLHAQVRNQDDSLKIIDRLGGTGKVQVGFTAQRVDGLRHPDVASAGVVELQPLFLFLRRGLAEPLRSPAGLAGRRLVMPLEGSATAQAAQDLLARYDVTRQNASFGFLKMGEAAAALQRGEYDAGFFMLAPDNALVRQLALDPGLVLYSFDDSVGIARHIDYLKPATLARGAFDLKAVLPPRDVSLIGATVNVIVREDIHPAVLYALLQAMSDVHKGQTLVSDPGTYPRQAGTTLPVHPLAQAWAKNGTPWLFTHLPPDVAGVVDAYWGPVLVLLGMVSAFGSLQSLNGFINGAVLALVLRWLVWWQRRVQRGVHPGRVSRLLFRLLAPVVVQQDAGLSARDRLEHLRPHMAG